MGRPSEAWRYSEITVVCYLRKKVKRTCRDCIYFGRDCDRFKKRHKGKEPYAYYYQQDKED